MEIVLVLAAGFAVVMVPAVILIVRSKRSLTRARTALAVGGIPVDEQSAWGQATRAGRTKGLWVTAIVVGLVVIGYLLAIIVTRAIEPAAAAWLVGVPALVAIGPFLLVLAVLIPCWILGCTVSAGHRLLTSTTWGDAATEPVTRAVHHLRSVTWSQTGVTGIGVVAGALSVIFGAGLIAALFVVATTAISCARDPKCI